MHIHYPPIASRSPRARPTRSTPHRKGQYRCRRPPPFEGDLLDELAGRVAREKFPNDELDDIAREQLKMISNAVMAVLS